MTTTKKRSYTKAAITCTLTSLADNGYRQSAIIDNTVNQYLDAELWGSIQVGAVAADGVINIWGYAGGGAAAPDILSGGLNGSDVAVNWGTSPATSSVEGFNQLVLLGTVSVDTTDDNNDIEFFIGSVAQAFGGYLPDAWGIVVENQTGVALHATGTNNLLEYAGIKAESV